MNLLANWTAMANLAEAKRETHYSWLLPAASTNADHVDWLFYFIMGVCIFFFVLIFALQVWYCVKYRRKSEHDDFGQGATHNTPLEVTWSVLPLFIVLYMFYWGMVEANALATTPANAYNVDVTAVKWSWSFRYPGGLEHNELHMWKDQPVRLTMRSQDVLHSFFVPEFRTKKDIVPGRYSEIWVQSRPPEGTVPADYPLKYRLFCTEYCGKDHWNMKSWLVVHETEEDFREWLKLAGVRPDNMSKEQYGEQLWSGRGGCKSCHAVEEDAAPGTGPNWYETSVALNNGGMRKIVGSEDVPVDANYLRTAILQPGVELHANYPSGGMPYKKLSDDDIDSLIAYIRSLAAGSK